MQKNFRNYFNSSDDLIMQAKIQEELTEIFGDSKRPMKLEDLNKMKYLDCCIKESLRMYPPVHFISRKLSETTKLSKYFLNMTRTLNR